MKIAQVMAGAPTGGAELFFERLSIALHRAGDAVLPVIRRDEARAARLAAAGLAPRQLGFGGPADLLTGPRLRGLLRRFAPARGGRLDEPRRAASPRAATGCWRDGSGVTTICRIIADATI